MYCRTDPSPRRASGVGPSLFAKEVDPFPLVTQSVLPSRLTRTLVGYQPVGMNPSGVECAGSLTFTIARSLVLALATKRMDPSGESASEFGVQPDGAFG